jgi:hypothetical protein
VGQEPRGNTVLIGAGVEARGTVICRFVNGPVVPHDRRRNDIHLAGVNEPPRELRMGEISPGVWEPLAGDTSPSPGALVYRCIGIAGNVDGMRVFFFYTWT